jgi:hypothetical protein
VDDFPTLSLLRRRYGSVCIPLDTVRRHYANHLGMPRFLRKIREKEITLRVVKGDWGGRTQRVVYLHDLAQWIEGLQWKADYPLGDDQPPNDDDRSSEPLGVKTE